MIFQEAFARMSASGTQHVALALLHFLWQGMLVVLVLAWSTSLIPKHPHIRD